MQPGAHREPDTDKAPSGSDQVANGVAPPSAPASSWKPVRVLQVLIGAAVAVFGVFSLLSTGSPSVTAAPRVSTVPPRMEASSPNFELVVTVESREIVLYLADFVDNAPIPDAKLTLSLDEREVPVVERGGGIYTAANAGLTGPSQTAVTVSVVAGGRQDLLGGVLDVPGGALAPSSGWNGWSLGLPLGAWLLALGAFILGLGIANGRNGRAVAVATVVLLVWSLPAAGHPGHGDDDTPVSREDLDSSTLPPNSPRRLPDGSLFVPKQAQFVLGIRTGISRQGEANRVVRLVGRVSADPAASGTVQSTMPGRVELAPGGLPRVGQRVVRGEVLASIVPVINPIDRGNILQQLALIDRDLTTLKQRAEDAIGADADIKLTNALTAEVETLLRRRAAINRIIIDREGMQIPLRAPADGVISVANAIAGQIVESRTTLYEIVDPERVWVEASGYDPTLLDAIAGANAVTADGRSLPLSFLGHGPKLNQQAIPILFHVQEPTMLPIGTPVLVLVETRDKHKGIILPPAAVVRNPAGQAIVWQHTGAERFVPLLVKVEPIDGRSVAVVAGLLENKRVVVTGAELLSQVR